MDEGTGSPPGHDTHDRDGPPGKRRYHPPTLQSYGALRDLTLTAGAWPNFDGGGGANIYMS